MVNIVPVANELLDLSRKEEIDMSKLKFQWLLYYVQAFYFVEKNVPLFEGSIRGLAEHFKAGIQFFLYGETKEGTRDWKSSLLEDGSDKEFVRKIWDRCKKFESPYLLVNSNGLLYRSSYYNYYSFDYIEEISKNTISCHVES